MQATIAPPNAVPPLAIMTSRKSESGRSGWANSALIRFRSGGFIAKTVQELAANQESSLLSFLPAVRRRPFPPHDDFSVRQSAGEILNCRVWREQERVPGLRTELQRERMKRRRVFTHRKKDGLDGIDIDTRARTVPCGASGGLAELTFGVGVLRVDGIEELFMARTAGKRASQ